MSDGSTRAPWAITDDDARASRPAGMVSGGSTSLPRRIASYGSTPLPLAIAHRGGAGLAAENTIDAFARSYALGLRYLETDARVTADGMCVAFHDATLRRVRQQPGRVRDTSSRDLDAPAIVDLLDAFPDAHFAIDVKDADALGPLARAIAAAGAAHRVCVAGAWDAWLARLRAELGPALTTALGWRALAMLVARAPLTGRSLIVPPWRRVPARVRRGPGGFGHGGFARDPAEFARRPAEFARRPAEFAHVPARLASWRTIAVAHTLGLRVIVWTVNEPTHMQRLLDSGADGIITDRPDLLRDVLIARDQWAAPESSAESHKPDSSAPGSSVERAGL